MVQDIRDSPPFKIQSNIIPDMKSHSRLAELRPSHGETGNYQTKTRPHLH
jgi:hypothetical protein